MQEMISTALERNAAEISADTFQIWKAECLRREGCTRARTEHLEQSLIAASNGPGTQSLVPLRVRASVEDLLKTEAAR